jgi:hypothetical protein
MPWAGCRVSFGIEKELPAGQEAAQASRRDPARRKAGAEKAAAATHGSRQTGSRDK